MKQKTLGMLNCNKAAIMVGKTVESNNATQDNTKCLQHMASDHSFPSGFPQYTTNFYQTPSNYFLFQNNFDWNLYPRLFYMPVESFQFPQNVSRELPNRFMPIKNSIKFHRKKINKKFEKILKLKSELKKMLFKKIIKKKCLKNDGKKIPSKKYESESGNELVIIRNEFELKSLPGTKTTYDVNDTHKNNTQNTKSDINVTYDDDEKKSWHKKNIDWDNKNHLRKNIFLGSAEDFEVTTTTLSNEENSFLNIHNDFSSKIENSQLHAKYKEMKSKNNLKKDKNLMPKTAEKGLRCNLCLKNLNSLLQAVEHFGGKIHQKNVAKTNNSVNFS